jgi:hypothetical protein
MIRAVATLLALATVTTAAEPRAFTTVAVLQDDEAFAGAHDVELQGNFAFVPGKGGSLAVIDVADSARPQIVWSRRDSKVFDDAETVLPAGDFLFLGTRDFSVLNISDPTRPSAAAGIRQRDKIDRINGFARRGDVLFAANKSGWIDAFDVDVPERPILHGALSIAERDGIGSPHDVSFVGDLLAVVDPAGFGRRAVPGNVGLYQVLDDTSSEALPAERWRLVGKASDERLVGGNRVRGYGKFAVVASSLSPEAINASDRRPNVAVIDCTDPANPKVVGTVPFPDVRGPNGLDVVGKVAFAAGGQTVMAVDLSDPHKPVLLAAEKCLDVFHGDAGRDDGHDLEYRDGLLYVTGQTSNTFGVLRVEDARIRELCTQ